MKSWFDALEEREKIMVIAAAVVVALAIFWLGVWQPLDRGQASAAARVGAWRLALAELRPLKGQIQASAAAQSIAANQEQSLVVIVDGTLRQRGLHGSLERSQPSASGNSIRVDFDNAAFDDLMLWLGDVNQQYGLMVESGSFSLASSESPGRVNSSLNLER